MNRWIGSMFAVLFAVGCGSSGETKARIGAEGGSVATAGVRLAIPAGALQAETEIRMREVEPGRGHEREIELEPRGLVLASPATVSFPVSDDPANHEVEIETEHGVEVQVEHPAGHEVGDDHPRVTASVSRLGKVSLRGRDHAEDDGTVEHPNGDDDGVDVNDAPDDDGVDANDAPDDHGVDPQPHA